MHAHAAAVSLLRVCMCRRRTARRSMAGSLAGRHRPRRTRTLLHASSSIIWPASTVLDSATKGRPGRPASLITDQGPDGRDVVFCTHAHAHDTPDSRTGCTGQRAANDWRTARSGVRSMHRAPFNLFIRGAAASVSSRLCAPCAVLFMHHIHASLLCAVLWADPVGVAIIREPARVIFHGRPAPLAVPCMQCIREMDARPPARVQGPGDRRRSRTHRFAVPCQYPARTR